MTTSIEEMTERYVAQCQLTIDAMNERDALRAEVERLKSTADCSTGSVESRPSRGVGQSNGLSRVPEAESIGEPFLTAGQSASPDEALLNREPLGHMVADDGLCCVTHARTRVCELTANEALEQAAEIERLRGRVQTYHDAMRTGWQELVAERDALRVRIRELVARRNAQGSYRHPRRRTEGTPNMTKVQETLK